MKQWQFFIPRRFFRTNFFFEEIILKNLVKFKFAWIRQWSYFFWRTFFHYLKKYINKKLQCSVLLDAFTNLFENKAILFLILSLCLDKTRSRKDFLYWWKKFCNFCHRFFQYKKIFFIHHWEVSVKMQ